MARKTATPGTLGEMYESEKVHASFIKRGHRHCASTLPDVVYLPSMVEGTMQVEPMIFMACFRICRFGIALSAYMLAQVCVCLRVLGFCRWQDRLKCRLIAVGSAGEELN